MTGLNFHHILVDAGLKPPYASVCRKCIGKKFCTDGKQSCFNRTHCVRSINADLAMQRFDQMLNAENQRRAESALRQ